MQGLTAATLLQVAFILLSICFDFILRSRETWRVSDAMFHSPDAHSGSGTEPQEFRAGLQSVCQGPNNLNLHLLPPRVCTNRNMG